LLVSCCSRQWVNTLAESRRSRKHLIMVCELFIMHFSIIDIFNIFLVHYSSPSIPSPGPGYWKCVGKGSTIKSLFLNICFCNLKKNRIFLRITLISNFLKLIY
jgi:hypothetical protein